MKKTNNNSNAVEKKHCADKKIDKQKQKIISLINSNADKQKIKNALIYLSIYLGED